MYILISPVTYWDKLDLNFNVVFNLLDRASDLIFIGETKILRCKAENQMLTSICSWEELSFDASGGRRRLKQQMDTTTDRIEINMIRSKSHKNMKIMPGGTGAQKILTMEFNWKPTKPVHPAPHVELNKDIYLHNMCMDMDAIHWFRYGLNLRP